MNQQYIDDLLLPSVHGGLGETTGLIHLKHAMLKPVMLQRIFYVHFTIPLLYSDFYTLTQYAPRKYFV